MAIDSEKTNQTMDDISSKLVTNFENLSDEIIISIIEYLTLEDFISIFGKLNTRLASIIFDHPWTHHQLNIRTMDDKILQKKLDFIDEMKLTSKISSIYIRPHSIFHSIETFNQYKSIDNFSNVQALSLNNITLDEAETVFNPESLSKLINLTRISVIFSLGLEDSDYGSRMEKIISNILNHSTLQHCIIHTARPVTFSELQTASSVIYLDLNFCSFQSLYKLFQFTPKLRHLTAAIVIYEQINIDEVSKFPILNSITLSLSIPAFDELNDFLKNFPKLQKLSIITYSAVVEPLTVTSTWFKFITDHSSALTKFKREGNVALENIEEYIKAFHWPNGWQLEETRAPNGTNYSRITTTNTRY